MEQIRGGNSDRRMGLLTRHADSSKAKSFPVFCFEKGKCFSI